MRTVYEVHKLYVFISFSVRYRVKIVRTFAASNKNNDILTNKINN